LFKFAREAFREVLTFRDARNVRNGVALHKVKAIQTESINCKRLR
jgi:hypothetical protein